MVRLIPIDEKYFDLLEALSRHMTTALTGLSELLADPARADELVPVVRAEEHAADELVRVIAARLDRTFVTPFDREDIHTLARRLDRVADLAEDAAQAVAMFHLGEPDEGARDLAAVLLRAGRVLEESVARLRNPRELLGSAGALKPLEEEGDAIYARAMSALFAGTPDPLDALKRKALYDKLEDAIDECEDVADVLDSVALQKR